MVKKTLFFNIDSSLVKIKNILQNKDFLYLEFWAISDAYPNDNNSHFPLNTIEDNIKNGVFYNKPILGKFNNFTNNYEVHNHRKAYDPDYDMEYYDYENGERPLGLIRESDNIRIEKDEQGLNWVVFSAVVWIKYNFRGVKKILEAKTSKVSVEVSVLESHKDEHGIEIFDKWIFDGITILGYKPNTKVEAREGMKNAKMTIFEKMKNHFFVESIKGIQFAYEELDKENENNIDIKENNSHLYIKKFNKGGSKMDSVKEKELENFESEENKDDIKKPDASEKKEDIKEDEKFEEKPEEKSGEEKKENIKEDNNSEGAEDVKMEEDNLNSDEDGCDCKKEDSEKDDALEDLKKEEESCEDSEDSENEEPDKKENCGNFEKEFNELNVKFENLTSEHESMRKDYESVKTEYEDLKKTNEELVKKVAQFEEKEKQEKIEFLCTQAENIAKKEGFDKEIIDGIVDKCKKEVFVSEEDVIKEIAFISFKNRDTKSDKSEFSTKVPDKKVDVKKDAKTSFERLQNYIKN